MGIYKDWEDHLKSLKPQAAKKFMEDYYDREKDAYAYILANKKNRISGKASDIAAELKLTDTELAGFLDGINTSLETELDIDSVEADTELDLSILWNELYKNMHKAKADWLYGLSEWDGIFTKEEQDTLLREYRKSVQAVSHKVGRNDPCPCGSGLKYKNCCGA